tara:strand:- start:13244 stop:14386 length:1143 start_codon:yes stop_codon:yes gene_type:complete
MSFNINETDRLLSTTRSVKRRLDLQREVSEEIILDCIDIAEQAPTGGNQSSRRWLVIRDPETKKEIADLYREVGGKFLKEQSELLDGTGHHNEKTIKASSYLAEHLEEVPVIVLVTIYGQHDGSGRPGLFDSVIQAAWSFCLALHSRGLGSAWTTMHLGNASKIAELLDIPEGVTQVVLLPVAHTIGDKFSPVSRDPAREITWFEKWGKTTKKPTSGLASFEDEPGLTVETDVKATPAKLWDLISDINISSRFSNEFEGADWLDEPPREGARFKGRNKNERIGEWEVTCHVTSYEPNKVFAWAVGDVEKPAATWEFRLTPLAGATRLRFAMVLGPGPSGLTRIIEQAPDSEKKIISNRQKDQHVNMRETVEGIKKLAEKN